MLDYAARFNAYCEGVTFTGRRFDWTPGVYVTGVEGILGGASTSYESIASGAGDGDGEFDTPNVRTGPRVITISGFVYQRTMIELGHEMRRLDGLLVARSDLATFGWEEFGDDFWTRVRRGSGGSVRRRGATKFADYTIRFRAPTQPYFGEKRTAGPGTSLQLLNRGTYPARPVFTVTGAMPSGYKLAAGGVEYIVTQAIAGGQTHRIDMRTLMLQLNGVAQVGAVSAPRRIEVPPMSPLTMSLVPVAGAGQVSADWADSFM